MKEILIETQFLPPILVFSQMANADLIWLEALENYQKGSYRNRCYIAGVNSTQALSIPLRKSKDKTITAILVAYDEHWQSQHRHSIKSAYGNAPYFDYYSDPVFDLLTQKTETLWEYNLHFLRGMFELLQLDKEIRFTTAYQKEQGRLKDFRNQFSPNPAKNKIPFPSSFSYPQVFTEKHGFLPNLSILDLLFCAGPESTMYLSKLSAACDLS